jgi:hypothetical protein
MAGTLHPCSVHTWKNKTLAIPSINGIFHKMNLTTLEVLPEGLLNRSAQQLHEVLDGPTLIHLRGSTTAPLFVSVLLHGNETTGWEALRQLLLSYHHQELPRSLSLFIGNVAAAAEDVRHLPGQPDYNRIWSTGDTAEQQMMQSVIEQMRERGVFASIDLHNNTGRNPHYGCINRLEPAFLQLAKLFSHTVVFFTQPAEVQSMAFSNFCPAITVECGRPGEVNGITHALNFLQHCLKLSEIPTQPVTAEEIALFHTVATVKVPDTIEISFGTATGDLCLINELDQLNFQEIPAGTPFGRVCSDHLNHLEVWSESGQDVGDNFFTIQGGRLQTSKPVMPSMLTKDIEIIRQDCLCYLMERLEHT